MYLDQLDFSFEQKTNTCDLYVERGYQSSETPSKVVRTNDGVDMECDGISFEGLSSYANERESARRRRRIGDRRNSGLYAFIYRILLLAARVEFPACWRSTSQCEKELRLLLHRVNVQRVSQNKFLLFFNSHFSRFFFFFFFFIRNDCTVSQNGIGTFVKTNDTLTKSVCRSGSLQTISNAIMVQVI